MSRPKILTPHGRNGLELRKIKYILQIVTQSHLAQSNVSFDDV